MNLTKELGRVPTVYELSEHMDVPVEEILMAQEASSCPYINT